MPTTEYKKVQSNKLAPNIIAGIIQYIEEQPINNTDWIKDIHITKDNTWTVTIKQNIKNYPKSIKKYIHLTNSYTLYGKLFQIEEQLSNIYNQPTHKII